jgi:hypothetical protein
VSEKDDETEDAKEASRDVGPYRAADVPPSDEPYERALASWDFPSFARRFPRDPKLDALVIAYAKGDFKTVGIEAPKLATASGDDAVKNAALLLAARTRPDPAAKMFFLLATALLAFLTIWWVTHDGPPKDTPAPTKPVPTVEYVN